ncbi:MAG: aromatic ring-hydroxylating dioxygenase subunit alpha, partial [Rhizobiales bacterium]|nr:aromatic ring-hydroxylating dioxygenase subunit alpha [Hyphomicrobiales bacterium]
MNTSVLVHSLEANYYTDPQIFQTEQRGLLARTWQYAGHVSQVENAGDYFAFQIAGQNLFCIRGRDGEVRAFFN